ncbi:major facilitator superfamily domain-containing protein [Pseudomassariella vexata]|uniref:Major facilitator superfamily domain-containing protein n=1 Tax=Pseudomassariella vexata TaxID=1141098 RepID=A0A1Y2D9E7_9PEZI|nr:major facilitator superfamily domain-containing protein [Pseudomassariella vexata]ORY55883.1 major facilitator superfamily domain-containing protein [Pseudomassariella vexata]
MALFSVTPGSGANASGEQVSNAYAQRELPRTNLRQDAGIDAEKESNGDSVPHQVWMPPRTPSRTLVHEPEQSGDAVTADAIAASPEPAAVTGLAFILLMFSVVSAGVLVALNVTILGTAIPAITTEFNSINDVGWYVSAFSITICAMAPFTGKLFRLFRIKATFICFIVIFMISSLLAGLARSSDMLIAAHRRIWSYLNDILMGFFAVGQATGPLIGGSLTSYASWRWCFFINLPLGAVVLILVVFVGKFPELSSASQKGTILTRIRQIDIAGFFIFAIGNTMFLLGLQWGGTDYPWSSATVIGLMCGGVATFGVLAAWFSYKKESALIPTRVFKSRINIAIGLTAFIQSGATITSLHWLPIWFQAIKQVDAIHSGIMILPLILSQVFASVLTGALVQKTGYYLPEVITGNVLIGVGSGLMATFARATTTGQWIGYQILVGAGRGMVLKLLVTAVQANMPKEDASIASGYSMFSQFFGGAVFTAVAKTVFTSSIAPALAKFAPSVDARLLVNNGATELQKVIPADQISGVLLAYNEAIDYVFYLQLAAACCAFVTG